MSEFAEERREERRERMAAAIDAANPDPVEQLGYDPEMYEVVDDEPTVHDEPEWNEHPWSDHATEMHDKFLEATGSPQAAVGLGNLHAHLDALERQSGLALGADRDQFILDALDEMNGAPLTAQHVESKFYANVVRAKAADARASRAAAEEAAQSAQWDLEARLQSRDETVRRNARREVMAANIEAGQGWGIRRSFG